MWNIGLYGLSILFVVAGLFHFYAPNFYRPLMPPYLPAHDALIYISGVMEVFFGLVLLWPSARPWVAWSIIAFLLAILPVHIFMFQERNGKFAHISQIFLWLRIPFQGLLIAWAYQYTAK